MIVPGSYGSRSIKWLTRILLTNDFKANDSDADLNNDPDNAQKTRARFINPPKEAAAGEPFALTGLVQIGVSGISKVQYAIRSREQPWPENDPYRTRADWKDGEILPPPHGLGRGPAWRRAAGGNDRDGSGRGHAASVADALHHRALGGAGPRCARG